MLEALSHGFMLVFAWPAFGYLLAGVGLGIIFGAVPGLSGLTGMAILLPFTFDLDPASAMAMLLGMYAVTTTADTLTAVMIGVPGTAAGQATVLDGYPLAKQGQAARAFGAAFTCSAIGGVLGAVILALSVPIVRPLIMSFASPELLMLGVLGLTMLGSLTGRSMWKGLAAAALGLGVSMIGYSPQGGIARYTLGFNLLLDGLPLVPIAIGLFAIPELIELTLQHGSISRAVGKQTSRIWDGVRDTFDNWGLVLRSGFIGAYIGMLPALGAVVADWIAYGHAVQGAKDKSRFGHGDIRGVIAPETANNSVKGGSVIPTIAFGIPGSPPMAILLGAFLMHGLTPGPSMLGEHLDITFSLVWILVFANILAAGLLMAWSQQFCRLAVIPGRLLVPGITLFVLMGAWMADQRMGDWVILILAGVLGVFLKKAGWSRPALILGFILGPIVEKALDLSTQIYGYSWIERPIPALIAVGIVAMLVWKAVQSRKAGSPTVQVPLESPDGEENALVSMTLGVACAVFGAWMCIDAWYWPDATARFPLLVGAPTAVLGLVVVIAGARTLLQSGGASGLVRADVLAGSAVVLWLSSIPMASLLVDQRVVIPAAMIVYFLIWSRDRWLLGIVQALAAAAILVFLFDGFVHVLWYSSIFSL